MSTKAGKSLGEAIKAARKKAGLTQEELAAIIKIAPRTYQAYEAGEVLPRYITLFKIAKATGTTAPRLLAPRWDDWSKRK